MDHLLWVAAEFSSNPWQQIWLYELLFLNPKKKYICGFLNFSGIQEIKLNKCGNDGESLFRMLPHKEYTHLGMTRTFHWAQTPEHNCFPLNPATEETLSFPDPTIFFLPLWQLLLASPSIALVFPLNTSFSLVPYIYWQTRV